MLKKQNVFHILFTLSIILKCMDGLFELIGGLFFVILEKQHILNLISDFLHYNLFNISNATILKFVTYISSILTEDIKIFISTILICNGFIKIVLSINLLQRKLLAFPIALGFLILLFIYQIVQTLYTPSIYLILFDAFDAIVICVIWIEYLRLKRIPK